MRECIKPKDGYIIYGIDFSGLEIACTAGVLRRIYGKSKLADLLDSGDTPTDVHSYFASKIKGCSFEEFLANKKKDEYKNFRATAKPIVLGIPGGSGPKTIAKISKLNYDVDMTEQEASDLRELYFETFPEVKKFMKSSINNYKIDEDNYSYKYKELERNNCNYCQLCNGVMMQTPAAFGAKKVIIKLFSHLFQNPDMYFICFVHDEIVVGIKKNKKELTNLEKVCRVMCEEMYNELKVRVAVEAGRMPFYSKVAEKETLFWFDKNGFHTERGN